MKSVRYYIGLLMCAACLSNHANARNARPKQITIPNDVKVFEPTDMIPILYQSDDVNVVIVAEAKDRASIPQTRLLILLRKHAGKYKEIDRRAVSNSTCNT